MKIYEIITESEIVEGRLPPVVKVTEAKRLLKDAGFFPVRPGGHEIWKNAEGVTYRLSHKHGSSLKPHETDELYRKIGLKENDELDEAVGLPSDTSSLLSLLSEMISMLGSGGPTQDAGTFRAAIMQVFNNGSADDSDKFIKQTKFRVGSLKAAWMAKNWPQLKSCFLRLKKIPKYQNSIKSLSVLGDWPIMAIKDAGGPTLSKYFSTILEIMPDILKDVARFEPEEHIRTRAAHLSKIIPERLHAYDQFLHHWADQYDSEMGNDKLPEPKRKDNITGKQNAAGQDIVDKVLSAIPSALAKRLRPEVQRMGSINEKMMFLMRELQKAGIDPNKVLG